MKVLLLSRYSRQGASSRLRSYQYIPKLASWGIEVEPFPLLGDSYLKNLYASSQNNNFYSVTQGYAERLLHMTQAKNYDLLWIEKELFPWLPAFAERILALLQIPYVVDYDDAIFHNYDLNRNRLVKTFLGQKIDVVMRGAKLVIVGNNYLKARAYQAGAKRVALLPTVVDLERYGAAEKSQASKALSIGWIGTPKSARYLEVVREALESLAKKQNIKLVLVGSGEKAFGDFPVEIKQWSEETEVAEIQNFDLGIMPLLDGPGERGKCGYKLIQYMACAKPVVASPVAVNRDIVEHNKNGYLASSTEEWVEAFRRLSQENLRQRMGTAGRKKVENEYALQVSAPHLAELLNSSL